MARLHEGLLRELSEEIVGGVPAPGERLPREVDLAQRFGVSRGTVRELLRALEERGLVSVKHGRGATVNEPGLWNVLDDDVLELLIAADGGRRLGEVLECQRMVEVQAAGLAAQRATAADLAQLDAAVREMTATVARIERSRGGVARYREAQLSFHRCVVRASGNATLARLSEPLHRALASVERRGEGTPAGRLAAEMEGYRRVRATIAARDADRASAAMERALRTLERGLLTG